jgi:YggT family protein
MNLLFLSRTIISWYPKTNKDKFPINAIYWPTEPLLQPVRELVPPTFGVDISPIILIMVLSFFREVLTGPQGVLSLFGR